MFVRSTLFLALCCMSSSLPYDYATPNLQQRRRLRRHKQEAFKLPSTVGNTRRKGSHKSIHKPNDDYYDEPNLPALNKYSDHAEIPFGAEADTTYYPSEFPTYLHEYAAKKSKKSGVAASRYQETKKGNKGSQTSFPRKGCYSGKKSKQNIPLEELLLNTTTIQNVTLQEYEYDCSPAKASYSAGSRKAGKGAKKSAKRLYYAPTFLPTYLEPSQSPYPTVTAFPGSAEQEKPHSPTQAPIFGVSPSPIHPPVLFGSQTQVPTSAGQQPGEAQTLAPSSATQQNQTGAAATTSPEVLQTSSPTPPPTDLPTSTPQQNQTSGSNTTLTLETGAPTTGQTAVQRAGVPSTEVDLFPFGLLFDVVMDKNVPTPKDYSEASQIVFVYLESFFSTVYGKNAESHYDTGSFSYANTAYNIENGAIIDFLGRINFKESDTIPTSTEIDKALDSAFTGANVPVILDLLAMLPTTNLFSTTTNVRKVEPTSSTPARNSRPSSTRTMLEKVTFSVAGIGMLGLLVYGAVRFWFDFRKGEHVGEKGGAYFGGDDMLVGEHYNRAFLIPRNSI